MKDLKTDGTKYNHAERKLNLYDYLNKPARTMLTNEETSNRSTHIVETKKGPRFLSPIEWFWW